MRGATLILLTQPLALSWRSSWPHPSTVARPDPLEPLNRLLSLNFVLMKCTICRKVVPESRDFLVTPKWSWNWPNKGPHSSEEALADHVKTPQSLEKRKATLLQRLFLFIKLFVQSINLPKCWPRSDATVDLNKIVNTTCMHKMCMQRVPPPPAPFSMLRGWHRFYGPSLCWR